MKQLERVVEHWPKSFAAPAALYWSGAAGKVQRGDAAALLNPWRRLLRDYSESAWAMKVSFIESKR